MNEFPHSFSSVVSLIGISGITWLVFVIIYRLYFHPLSKYPGPFLAKFTDWYNVYHCVIGDRHLEFYRIHRKYGNIVRYGPNRVSINSATALRAIYNPKANCRKSKHFAVFPKFFHSWSTQSMIDTKKFQHTPKRRAISQALHGKAVKQIEEAVSRNVDKFCTILEGDNGDEWSSSVNMSELTSYLSFDIMGEVCFGQTFGMQEHTENRYIVDIVSTGAQCLNTLGHMQQLLWTGLHRILFHKLLVGLKSYKEYSRLQCDRALRDLSRGSDDRGVFQALLSAQRPGTSKPLFTSEELLSESSLLIIAGSDTTSTSIAATLFYLLHHPECLEKARKEVLNTFSPFGKVRAEASELQKCHYLRACVEESLRMSPPVGGLMPRETLSGGMIVDGEHFPADIELGTPTYALHHDERYYLNPFQYDPRRWLINNTSLNEESKNMVLEEFTTASQLAAAEEAFCAFSIGPRNCIGKSMAYHELMSVLATLLWQFDMRLDPGNNLGEGMPTLGEGRRRKNEYQLYDAFSSKSAGPMVQLRRRTYVTGGD